MTTEELREQEKRVEIANKLKSDISFLEHCYGEFEKAKYYDDIKGMERTPAMIDRLSKESVANLRKFYLEMLSKEIQRLENEFKEV